MSMTPELEDYSKSRFKAALFEISEAEQAFEKGERALAEKHIQNAREIFDEILDPQLAETGKFILNEVLQENEPIVDDCNDNSTCFKFENIWKWCLDVAPNFKLVYEWNDDLKRIILPKKTNK